MIKKENVFRFLSMDNKRIEKIISLIAITIEAIAITLTISYNKFIDFFILFLLIGLILFLFILVIFQLKAIELFFESISLELNITTDYSGTIEMLLINLDLPSISIENSNIVFENLKLSIIENSRSLVMNTSKKNEKDISKIISDLIVFKQILDKGIENSNDLDFTSFNLNCTFAIEIEGLKIKGNAEEKTTSYPGNLLVMKSQDLIKIVYTDDYSLKKWKELKNLIYEK